MFRIALTQRIHEDGMAILQREAEVTVLNIQSPKIRAEDIAYQDGLIIRIGTLDRETILDSPHLRVIGRTGVGYDNIDLKTATERGIPNRYLTSIHLWDSCTGRRIQSPSSFDRIIRCIRDPEDGGGG